MGNQIVCPSGSDWYRKDLTLKNYQIERNLFDGTFSLSFKVQNVSNKKFNVVKAFWIDSPKTEKIVQMFNKTFEKMQKVPSYHIFGNLFSTPYVTKRGAYLIRPFVHQPLVEKITDHPPLHFWEKKWIAYQLLHAVKNLGEQGFWHGDIKPENVMINDSLQVSLVDHAPFKPSMIGTNQPHYFIHFFSYMRSCCFLAPERITDSNKYINFFAADIFSIACVIAYMYLDGQYLFNYTTVQQLKEDSQIPLLDSIDDFNIRRLLKGLIIVDHRERLKTFSHFETFFPSWFFEFYNRFRFALNDRRPNAFIYSFNREFLNRILNSSSSRTRLRRKSTSCLDFTSHSTKLFDVEVNEKAHVNQLSKARLNSALELTKMISEKKAETEAEAEKEIEKSKEFYLCQDSQSEPKLSSLAALRGSQSASTNPQNSQNQNRNANSNSQTNQNKNASTNLNANKNTNTNSNLQINQKQNTNTTSLNTQKQNTSTTTLNTQKQNTNSQVNQKQIVNTSKNSNANYNSQVNQGIQKSKPRGSTQAAQKPASSQFHKMPGISTSLKVSPIFNLNTAIQGPLKHHPNPSHQSKNSNLQIVSYSSFEFKHDVHSKIIHETILELKQSNEKSRIPMMREKSTPIMTIGRKSFNSLPVRRLQNPSMITFLKQDDPLIICIPLISDQFFTSKIAFNELCHLIQLFIYLSIRLKDPILKLMRCIPQLIGLFDYNNTAINVIAVNGLISVISSISLNSFKTRLFESNSSNDQENIDFIKLLPDYPVNYLIPHLYSSIKGSWSQQFFARLPFLIVHISRLWPSFLTDIHSKKQFIKNFIFDKLIMIPFIRASAQISVFYYNYQKTLKSAKNKVFKKSSSYPLFACFNKYMKTLFNSKYVSDLTHFYSMYITNFQPSDLSLFVRKDLHDLVAKMSLLLTKQTAADSRSHFVSLANAKKDNESKNADDEKDASIMLFFFELLKFFKMNLPLPTLSIIGESAFKMQFSSDCSVRTVVKQIMNVLPESLAFLKLGNTPVQKTRSLTHSFSKNFDDFEKRSGGAISRNPSKSIETTYKKKNAKIFKTVEESIKNDLYRPSFIYSQKLFQGEVNEILMQPSSGQITFLHSNSNLSLFEFREKKFMKFKEIQEINFNEKIDFLSRISEEEIILSAGSKVYLASNVQLKATFNLPSKFAFQKSFYNGQLLTVSIDSPKKISIRNINRSLNVVNDIEIGNIPTCVEVWENQPIFAFGTNENCIYTVDSRIGLPVYSIPIGYPFNRIISCPYSSSYQFGIITDYTIDFFDPRLILYAKKPSSYFSIKGNSSIVKHYLTGLMLMGQNGTFYANPNGSKSVVSLIDNKNIQPLPKSNDPKFDFELPSEFTKSLHCHTFQVSSMGYSNTTGLCCTGDKCGFVNMWFPPHVKYLNNS